MRVHASTNDTTTPERKTGKGKALFVNNSTQAQKAQELQATANKSPQAQKAQTFQLKADQWAQQNPVQKQEAAAQEEEQAPTPVYYGTNEENTWESDQDETSGENRTYDSREEAEARMEELQELHEWENYDIRETEEGNNTTFHVVMQGQRTVHNFIDLVRKVETAYPDLSTDEVIDGIRALAPGYNTNRWRLMLGKSEQATAITPVEGLLTQEDIDALRAMVEHGGDGKEDERGIARADNGDYVAMGHVLTGVAAGLNRNEETDLTSGNLESVAGFFGVGEYVDNLYATTIAGDLGQSATIVNNQDNVTAETPMIGDGTEATTAELFGDVDGFNIGHQESEKEDHENFSTLLQNYYASLNDDERENRLEYFKNHGMDDLEDQTTRFAANYTYSINGKLGGFFSEIGTESEYAVEQFEEWLEDQMEE